MAKIKRVKKQDETARDAAKTVTGSIFDNKKVLIAALVVIFSAGILLRTSFMNAPAVKVGPDEAFYINYASYMAETKDASIKKLFGDYLANKDWQVFPNPLRFGYIGISALWVKAIGHFDFRAHCYLSGLFSIAALFIGYLLTKKLFGNTIAVLTVVLLAASPLNLAMARRALQDSAVYFFIITSLYLFYLALQRRGALSMILFGLSFFAAMSVKESNFLLVIFFAFFALWDRMFFRRDLNLTGIYLVLIAALAATFLSYVWIAGGFAPVVTMAKIVLGSPSTNEYAVKYQTGNLLRYAVDFFLISPLTFAAGACFCIWYLLRRSLQGEPAVYMITFFVIYYLIYSFFSKNLRYVMALDLPIRIFAALFISNIFSGLGRRGAVVSLIIIAVISVTDIFIFRHMFLNRGIYDPVTAALLSCW